MLDGSIWLDSGLMGSSGLKRAFLWEIGVKKRSRARFFDMSADCGRITKYLSCEDNDARIEHGQEDLDVIGRVLETRQAPSQEQVQYLLASSFPRHTRPLSFRLVLLAVILPLMPSSRQDVLRTDTGYGSSFGV